MAGNTSRRYPLELKAPAVRMVAQVPGDHDWEWAAMSKVAHLLGVSRAGAGAVVVACFARGIG